MVWNPYFSRRHIQPVVIPYSDINEPIRQTGAIARGITQATAAAVEEATEREMLEYRQARADAALALSDIENEVSLNIAGGIAAGDVGKVASSKEMYLKLRTRALSGKSRIYVEAFDSLAPASAAVLQRKIRKGEHDAALIQADDTLSALLENYVAEIEIDGSILNDKIRTFAESVQSSVLLPGMQEKKIRAGAVDLLSAAIEQNPAEAMQRLEKGEYDRFIDADQKQKLFQKAQKIYKSGLKDSIYRGLYDTFRTADGEFNYLASIAFLRSPENQEKIGITADEAKGLADMLYSQFNQDNQMRQKMRDQEIGTETDRAVDLFLNGNAGAAVDLVQNSKVITGKQKLDFIDKLKAGAIDQADDPFIYNDLIVKIANGEILSSRPVFEQVAKGNLTLRSKDSLLKMISQKTKPSDELRNQAIKQVNMMTKTGLIGPVTDVEAAAKSRTINQVNSIYERAIEEGKSYEEIARLLAPEEVMKMVAEFSASLQQVSEAHVRRLKLEEKNDREKEAKPQAKPGETIDNFDKKKGWNK